MVWREFGEFPNESTIINRSILLSAIICGVLYLLVGVFGYLSFLELTEDNILKHYPLREWYFSIGKIGYTLVIIFSYPLLAYPLKASVDALINQYYYKNPDLEVSTKRRILEASVIFVVAYLLAILPIGIGVVFGIAGATVGSMVVVGLPCAFAIILDVDARELDAIGDHTRPWWYYRIFSRRKILPLFLFVVSLVLVVTGLLSIIGFTVLGGLDEAVNGLTTD